MRAILIALALSISAPAAAQVDYRFPGGDADRQHFYITAYRDLTGSGGGLQDWGCGTKTYDGHRGTDMGVGGFPGMDAGRDVVAAADGVVTYVNDGAFDRCTSGGCAGGGGFGNYVRVEHADGKVTYYGHLKKFSITVANGATVTCGQKLGEVGSSGNSTGPHLHFEPRLNNVSDDPFTGPCGGPISFWVDQGDYLGLPQTTCENAPPQHPLLSMSTEIVDIEGQARDSHPEGESAGIFDLEAGQSVTARFYIGDAETAVKATDVVVGVEAAADFLEVVDWQIFDDFAGNECGGQLCPNDANEHPENPPRQQPGEAFDLHLYALSPGETKMVELTLRNVAPTDGRAPHAPVRLWVKAVAGSYAKGSFDAAPENIDGAQTFNDGDLRQELVLDTWGQPDDGGGQDPIDPGLDNDGDEDPASGGCSTGAGGSPALVLGLLAFYRRRKSS